MVRYHMVGGSHVYDEVETDDLDIGTVDVLATGTVLPLMTVAKKGETGQSTSSSSFGDLESVENGVIQFDAFSVAPDDLVFATGIRGDPNGDELKVRWVNQTDSETIVETSVTGSSVAMSWSGFTDYDPTTTSSPVRLRLRHANADNATSVTTREAYLIIGVQL